MVGFKDGETYPRRRGHDSFHPTMVRFKAAKALQALIRQKRVSIPLWCDLKRALPGQGHHEMRFHPTMVGFKDILFQLRPSERCRFHPTMVRLKAVLSGPPYTVQDGFPSHYGAI